MKRRFKGQLPGNQELRESGFYNIFCTYLCELKNVPAGTSVMNFVILIFYSLNTKLLGSLNTVFHRFDLFR